MLIRLAWGLWAAVEGDRAPVNCIIGAAVPGLMAKGDTRPPLLPIKLPEGLLGGDKPQARPPTQFFCPARCLGEART